MFLVANFRLAPLRAIRRQILFDSFLLSDSSKSFCGHLIWENVLGRQGESRENSLEASVPKLGEHSLRSQKTEKNGGAHKLPAEHLPPGPDKALAGAP